MSSSYIYIVPHSGSIEKITEYGDIGNAFRSRSLIHDYIERKYYVIHTIFMPDDLYFQQMIQIMEDPNVDFNDRILIAFSYEYYIIKENIPKLIPILHSFEDQRGDKGNMPIFAQYLLEIYNGKYGEIWGVCFALHDDNDQFYRKTTNYYEYINKEELMQNNLEIFDGINA